MKKTALLTHYIKEYKTLIKTYFFQINIIKSLHIKLTEKKILHTK